MPLPRSSGILLHPTSLPTPYGIGDLGPAAFRWLDALARAKQTWWQILPLGPTGYADSPYQSFSAFAGNPNLISPEVLFRDGLLVKGDLVAPGFPEAQVDYEAVIPWKQAVTVRAWENFHAGRAPALRPAFEEFQAREASWLPDFSLYMALKDAHGGVSWQDWPQDLIQREPATLARVRHDLADSVELHSFRQFLFFRQWDAIKAQARNLGIRVIGDVPIFIAGDSVDAWSHPELFHLDEHRRPTVVAGVPPDYFSTTGQLWGNPLYNWPRHEETGFAWWIARLRGVLRQVELVRLDHFRGFQAYWEVRAGDPTAEKGRWVLAPGQALLRALHDALGGLPLIAEDLGVITPEVEALRTRWQLPGMRILQFAFGGAQEDRFLPHRHERNTVVYTGTHDNDTTQGWYEKLTAKERVYLDRYAPNPTEDAAWRLLRLAWGSVADLAIAPLQDVLSLGNEARMNMPGIAGGYWRWRFTEEQLTADHLDRLADMTTLYERQLTT